MSDRSPLGQAADAYAAQGLAVLPIVPHGKHPLTANGFKDATTDRKQVRAWWTATPTANIGALPASVGCIAFDVDEERHFTAAIALGLFAEPTYTTYTGKVATPAPLHRWYRHPAPGTGAPLNGIVVRADKGYVIMPPSVHPSGRPYTAEGSFADAIVLPDRAAAALAALAVPAHQYERTRATFRAERISEGGRHTAVCTITGKLARTGLDPELARELVHAFNAARCVPPLPAAEVDRIGADIYAKERATRPVVDLTRFGAASSVLPAGARVTGGRLDAVRRQLTGRRA